MRKGIVALMVLHTAVRLCSETLGQHGELIKCTECTAETPKQFHYMCFKQYCYTQHGYNFAD